MTQPASRIITPTNLASADYRDRNVELSTHPNDFATGDTFLVCSTLPFLPEGVSHPNVPLYPLGMVNSFGANEAPVGQFISQIGSERALGFQDSGRGSGNTGRWLAHANSLLTVLYRPSLIWMKANPALDRLKDRLTKPDVNNDWFKGMLAKDLDGLYDADLDAYNDRVVTDGSINSLMFKLPFGLVAINRDARNRNLSIRYYEQCFIRGSDQSMQAGQFQVQEGIPFEFERRRSLMGIGPWIMSGATAEGLPLSSESSGT